MNRATQVGPMARPEFAEDLERQVEESVRTGRDHSSRGKAATKGTGYFFEPTVLTDVHPDMSVGCEEVFGPVAALMRARMTPRKQSGLRTRLPMASVRVYGLRILAMRSGWPAGSRPDKFSSMASSLRIPVSRLADQALGQRPGAVRTGNPGIRQSPTVWIGSHAGNINRRKGPLSSAKSGVCDSSGVTVQRLTRRYQNINLCAIPKLVHQFRQFRLGFLILQEFGEVGFDFFQRSQPFFFPIGYFNDVVAERSPDEFDASHGKGKSGFGILGRNDPFCQKPISRLAKPKRPRNFPWQVWQNPPLSSLRANSAFARSLAGILLRSISRRLYQNMAEAHNIGVVN